MRVLLSRALFPLMLLAALAAAMAAMNAGLDSGEILLPLFLISMLLVACFERLLPYEPGWNRSKGDLRADASYLPMAWVVNGLLSSSVAVAAVSLGGWLSRTLDAELWPSRWPLLLQLPLAAVVAELFSYWAHRAMHEVPWLWRFHATHHSAPRLYWLNATRSHPGEMVFRGIVGLVPLAVLGAGEPLLLLCAVVAMVGGLFQHANIDFALGPLSWIFSIGELHRWHHSRERSEADRNYGDTFIFWDAVFGTRYLPADRSPPRDVGIEGLDAFPRGFWAQLESPFGWTRIEERSAALR